MGNKSKMTAIEKRRRLSELFVKGVEVRFNENGINAGDPTDTDVVIFVTPPSPLQREYAIRDAQAARANTMLNARRNANDHQAAVSKAFISEMNDVDLVEYLVAMGEQERQGEATRQVLGNPEWEDFDTLRDLMREYEEEGSPEGDPKWEALLEKDKRFGDQVGELVQELNQAAREAFRLMNRDTLEDKAFERRLEVVGTQEFVAVYEAAMLFYACRDDEDHNELFFESVNEMRSFPEEMTRHLADTLSEFISQVAEAKNSQRAEPGSESSDPPVKLETFELSTPEAATA